MTEQPQELSPAQRAQLEILAAVAADDPPEFDRDVRAYVETPTPDASTVFRSPELVSKTYEALNRLIVEEMKRERAAPRGTKPRERARSRLALLRRELEVVRPLQHLALGAAAEKGPRRRAEKILGRVMYAELREVMRALQGGASDAAAEKALRELLKARKSEHHP